MSLNVILSGERVFRGKTNSRIAI